MATFGWSLTCWHFCCVLMNPVCNITVSSGFPKPGALLSPLLSLNGSHLWAHKELPVFGKTGRLHRHWSTDHKNVLVSSKPWCSGRYADYMRQTLLLTYGTVRTRVCFQMTSTWTLRICSPYSQFSTRLYCHSIAGSLQAKSHRLSVRDKGSSLREPLEVLLSCTLYCSSRKQLL